MRDVVGFEGLYKVTSCGKIWSCRKKRFMKAYGAEGDYQMIGLWDENKKQHFDYVHRIVAKAYVPNPNNYPEVNHKDEVKSHNWWTNLEWCTRQYNLSYGNRTQKAKARLRDTNKHLLHVWRPVYCVELEKTFLSTNDAARQLGVSQSNVSLCCHGKIKTCGGYHLQFANN